MITSLTKEQEARIPEYVDKWIGYASSEVDFARAKSAIERVYGLMKKDKPVVLIANGPVDAFWSAVAIQLLRKDKKSTRSLSLRWDSPLGSTLSSTLSSTLYSSLYSTLDSSLDSSLRSSLDSTLDSSLGSSLYSSLSSSLSSSLRSSLRSSLYSTLGSSLDSTLYPALDSTLDFEIKKHGSIKEEMENTYSSLMVTQWFASWAGYYDYAEMIGVKFDKEAKGIFQDFCREVPLIYGFDKLAIICHKPEISWQKMPDEKGKLTRRILHNSNGPAIKYRDGYEVYCLNNVAVPGWLVKTDCGKLEVDKGLALENADQKAEFVRKYGIERLKKLGKIVDSYKNYDDEWFTKSEYELIDMSPLFKTLKYAPYLSMKNQSVPGVYHMEGVHPSVKTVQAAVDFKSKSKKPKIINIK